MSHQHGDPRHRPQDSGGGDLSPQDGVDDRRLPNPCGPAYDHEEGTVQATQPGHQPLLEVTEQGVVGRVLATSYRVGQALGRTLNLQHVVGHGR